MSANTKIEWADHTFNPWIGCNPISPGCINCYASDWAKRYGRDFSARTRTKTWGDPVRWNKQADAFFAEHGRRQRVFCASLADVFDNEVDPQWRNDLFDLIAATPNLDWLLLTKRIGNVKKMLPSDTSCDHAVGFAERFHNVWIGATIVNQAEADRDIPKLLAVPAAKRFLSMEPLLGPVELSWICGRSIQCGCGFGIRHNKPQQEICPTCEQRIETGPTLDWVIVGGESGANARPMHPDWVRNLRDECQAAGVPFFFKQWGGWICAGELRRLPGGGMPGFGSFDGCRHDMASDTVRVGKKAAGRLLDGREWNGVPA